MDDGEVPHLTRQTQVVEVFLVFVREVFARPVQRFLGQRVEAIERIGDGSLFVVVAFDDGTFQAADDFQALMRIRVVTDDVAETNEGRASVRARVSHDSLQRFQIRMDVAENRKTHVFLYKTAYGVL